MAKVSNMRVRVTHQVSVMAPGRLTLPSDQSMVICGVSCPPQKVADDSYLKIFLGDNREPQATWSVDELMLLYRRGGESFEAYTGEAMEALRAGWRRMANEWPASRAVTKELEATRLALEAWTGALNNFGVHVLRLPRSICLPPRQKLRLVVEPEPEKPIRVRLSGLLSLSLDEV